MPAAQSDNTVVDEKSQDLRFYMTREPVILAMLFIAAVVFFLAVGGLSRIYHAQQDSLGERWFTRGVNDLNAQHFDAAVVEFRAALRYSRDSYPYQLNLAEGLIGQKRTNEAYSYLVNLWDLQPENGVVNLALARIAAQRSSTEQALRYYHNAIYAVWPGDQRVERRNTRIELIEYLLGINAKVQAQSELIALAANLIDDPVQQARVGALFQRAQDYEHALAEYRLSLKTDEHNQTALAGAGLAAFELGRYPLAQQYLRDAVAADPSDTQSVTHLETVELVLRMDPFRRQISASERERLVVEAFGTAGERIKACPPAGVSGAQSAPQPTLADQWTKMEPQVNERNFRRNPDLVEPAMELVFNIQRLTNTTCGTPTGKDLALLMIAKLHETN